jgi:hypothetical protein
MKKRRLDMYATSIIRIDNHPTTNRAQYKVTRCLKANELKLFGNPDVMFYTPGQKVLYCKILWPKTFLLNTNKPYRVGNLINPRKALGIPKKVNHD